MAYRQPPSRKRDWNGTPSERFWRKVRLTDTCWAWLGSRNRYGYGEFRVDDRLLRAHRFAYELLIGPVPSDLELDHLCRNRWCVNPAHLEPVDGLENIKRGEVGRNHRDKTHCPHGHPYDEVNTYVTPSGSRHCRICSRARWHRWHRTERLGLNKDGTDHRHDRREAA